MKSKLIRTFISVPVPDSVFKLQRNIKSIVKSPKGCVKWIPRHHLHLTLKFIGFTPDSSIQDIRLVMDNIALKARPIKLKIEGTGCFPSQQRPRVLWVGVSGETHLLQGLVQSIQYSLDSIGFFKNETNFHPHITLGRLSYSQKYTPNISEFMVEKFTPIPFHVEKIQFICSELFPNGSVYTILGTHFFQNNSV